MAAARIRAGPGTSLRLGHLSDIVGQCVRSGDRCCPPFVQIHDSVTVLSTEAIVAARQPFVRWCALQNRQDLRILGVCAMLCARTRRMEHAIALHAAPDLGPATHALDGAAQAHSIAALARAANQLHDDYLLRYAGHVRLTRDLSGLDRLIDSLRQVQTLAQQRAGHSEGRWQSLLGIVERRLDEYTHERGAVAQIQAAAGTNDRRASQLTSRARLVLHRYVRHFAGQSRRDRDVQRLREMTADLEALAQALRPVSAGIHLRSVAEEIGAVQGFVEFFRAEIVEIEEARQSGGRAEQAEALATVLAGLRDGWAREVADQPIATRRLGLCARYVAAIDEVLEALLTVAHANLPPEHEATVRTATALLDAWQRETDRTRSALDAITRQEHAEALWNRADALFAEFRGRWTGEYRHPSERLWLAEVADALDEVERQLAEFAAEPELAPADRIARLRDALVLVEKTYDGTTAASQGGG